VLVMLPEITRMGSPFGAASDCATAALEVSEVETIAKIAKYA